MQISPMTPLRGLMTRIACTITEAVNHAFTIQAEYQFKRNTFIIETFNGLEMESIRVYPANERQKMLLKSLLEEMKVRFEMVKNNENALLSEGEFYAKIDKSIAQADAG